GFDVAMHDATGRRMSQAGRDLQKIVDRFRYWKMAAPLQESAQVFTLDEFKGNEVKPLIFAAKEDPGNVLVVELGGGPCLLLETANALRIAGRLRRQDLKGDRTVQLRVPRPNYSRHATDADRLQ